MTLIVMVMAVNMYMVFIYLFGFFSPSGTVEELQMADKITAHYKTLQYDSSTNNPFRNHQSPMYITQL